MKIQFYLRFQTSFGQTLWFSSNNGERLGTDIIDEAIPMTYLNEEFWEASIKIEKNWVGNIQYKYLLKNKNGEIIPEWGDDRFIELKKGNTREIFLVDTWNHAGDYGNVFYTAPFRDIFLKTKKSKSPGGKRKHFTHIFKVKAPLLSKREIICLAGSGKNLGEWSVENPLLFTKEGNWWVAHIDLTDDNFPIAYKYGIYNSSEKEFVRFEKGDNRLLYGDAARKKITIIHDGFAHFPADTWKGSGVTIPVFSLRSKKSFGVGEFSDLKLLVDWTKSTGLKMIQILPVNDTTATHTWMDSYPYAAISAFALHPVYINLSDVAGKKNAPVVTSLAKKQKELNALTDVDYEEVMKTKLSVLEKLYELEGKNDLQQEDFKEFFEQNRHWLVAYAVFCYLREKYGSSHFEEWRTNSVFDKTEIEQLASTSSKSYDKISFYYYIQYHLHRQLKEAADYAHKKGIILKGDIPIGIYRYGCDAWMAPELYNMCQQAGAPPDDFAVKGQNWGFPTYNWKKMQEDHFGWWQQRFRQMNHYFHAFRIDHILGFFRIWSIPMHAVEGILGQFAPAIPVHIREFAEKVVWFDYHRYCKPYITDSVLDEIFGELAGNIKSEYIIKDSEDKYDLELEFATQRQVEEHFSHLEATEENKRIKNGLFDLITNVILFEEEGSQGERFHFRISMENTSSFRNLDWTLQQKLNDLYINYFYYRQDNFWQKEAMQKLPYLKRATNMLVCGEDLGMVPRCVPEVMKQLGILSLEIQRMPKIAGKEFFHPNDAPYLSVVTPSTHDMSTIRAWWEEDPEKTKRFFNNELGQWGEAPPFCEPWINRAIILQHLYCPGMWSVFLLQDILGMSESLRRENPHEERINVPANPNNYWRYRMHLTLEDLNKQKDFNRELKGYVEHAGR